MRNDPTPLFERQQRLSAALGPDVDLVAWPEGAVGVEGAATGGDMRLLSEAAGGFQGLLVTGLVERFDRADGAGHFTNAVVAVNDGGLVDRYDKRIPVPFGERVPARDWLEGVVDLSLVPRDMVIGSGPPVLRTDVADIGVAISYENLFARVAREAVLAGAELLVVPTNASSYLTDEVPTQQLAGARLRARETARDLLLVGPTGPTALILADATVAARAPLDEPFVVRGRLAVRIGRTPYVVLGDGPVVGLAAASLAGLLAARHRTGRHDRRVLGPP